MQISLDEFQELFIDTIMDAQKFCFITRDIDLQSETCKKLENFTISITRAKEGAITNQDEELANILLSYEEIAMAVIYELKMWLAIKGNAFGEAWNLLIDAQGAIRNALIAHELATALEGENYSEKLHIYEKFLFPPQTFLSPGIIVTENKCSICKGDYEKCKHRKNKAYMGRICTGRIIHANLLEVSIVDVPANKRSRVLRRSNKDGDMVDCLTLKVTDKGEQNAIGGNINSNI